MITALLVALSVMTAAPQAVPTPLGLPVLEGATAAPDCPGYEGEDYSVFCVTTDDAEVQNVITRYIDWLRSQGFTIVPAPEADAGFFRAPCDLGMLNIVRLIDEQYRLTYLVIFRIAPPTICDGEPASMEGPEDEPPVASLDPVNHPALHHETHLLQHGDVAQRVP
jgi:hypothetical protein